MKQLHSQHLDQRPAYSGRSVNILGAVRRGTGAAYEPRWLVDSSVVCLLTTLPCMTDLSL